jgi:hypothetical protein
MLGHAATPSHPSAAVAVDAPGLREERMEPQQSHCCAEQEKAENEMKAAATSGERTFHCCKRTKRDGREWPTDPKSREGVHAV